MIVQLNPALPIITPKAEAYAHFLMDYGTEEHLLWVCFVNETGECWTFRNSQIRLKPNETFNRSKTSNIE